jgi:hypothetical protein
MARNKLSDQDRPRQRDVQKADVQKAYGRYSATEQGNDRRAHEQPAADAAPGQEAEQGAYDPDHEYRRYEKPDSKPKAPPKAQPKTKTVRDLGKRLSELS